MQRFHEQTDGCQILDVDAETQEGAASNENTAKKGKCAVIKTSTRQVCLSVEDQRKSLTGLDNFPSHHRPCSC